MSPKPSTPRALAFHFTRNTTCHGLAQVTRDDKPFVARIFWLLLIIGFTGGMCWMLTFKLMEYLQFVTDTELHEEYDSYIEFPAVSICNYNRFFNVATHEELAAVDGLIRISSPLRNPKYDYLWEKKIRDYYANTSHEPFLSKEVEDRGWPLNEHTIKSCTFTQKRCSVKNFTSFRTPMGNCFTFTSKEKIIQNVPGSGHGLLLTLNIYQDLYTEHPDYGRPEAGIKIHVHEHDEPPMVEEFGVGIPAGKMGHLIINKAERHLMYKPWGICNPSPKKMKYTHQYTFGECMTECRVLYIVEKCGCRPYWAPPQETTVECSVWDIMECSGPAEAYTMKLTPADCLCDQPCKSIVYDHKLSYATYPGIIVGEILAKDEEHPKSSTDSHIVLVGKDINISEADPYRLKLGRFRENYLMVDVYYESLSFTKITQSKKITEISLVSDIGGLLGLWLGISFVTLSEFVQFVAQLMATYCNSQEDEEAGSRHSSASPYKATKVATITEVTDDAYVIQVDSRGFEIPLGGDGADQNGGVGNSNKLGSYWRPPHVVQVQSEHMKSN